MEDLLISLVSTISYNHNKNKYSLKHFKSINITITIVHGNCLIKNFTSLFDKLEIIFIITILQ